MVKEITKEGMSDLGKWIHSYKQKTDSIKKKSLGSKKKRASSVLKDDSMHLPEISGRESDSAKTFGLRKERGIVSKSIA